MPSLKEVRNRIGSVKSTQQITKAMKMVAAAKLRRAQNGIIQLRPYAEKLDNVLVNVTTALNDAEYDNKYSVVRPIERVLIVVITSDKGLCGAFNSSVTRMAMSLIDGVYKKQNEAGNVSILSIGRKGAEFFQRRNFKVNTSYVNLLGSKELSFENARKAAEFAMDGYSNGTFDVVEIVYNEFKNVATQIVHHEKFLPIESSTSTSDAKSKTLNDYLFEPDLATIVDTLIPKSLKVRFYKAVLESNASEHGARMTAMDKATENAGELLKELQLSYNRARQANITKEILEIVGGAEALSQS